MSKLGRIELRRRSMPAVIAVVTLLGGSVVGTTAQTNAAPKNPSQRGVAALGRLEPLGGAVRVAAASTPDAVSGAVISKLLVERGADVASGQLLAEMDTAPVAKARVAETQAALETARRDAKAVASQAEEACVLADVAAKRSRRKTDLLARGLASSEESEFAKGDADAGIAACKSRTASVGVAQSRIDSVAAALARHRAELERSYIRAPFAGRILDVLRRPGELAGGEGIVELGRVDQMLAIAEVYETDVRLVRTGQRARIRSAALAADLGGAVVRIRPKVQKIDQIGDDPAARKDARIVEVEVQLDDSRPAANLTNLQVEIEIGR